MSKKLLISNSIMWAAAILVVSIVEEKGNSRRGLQGRLKHQTNLLNHC